MASAASLFEDPTFERTAIIITEIWFGSIVARVVKILFKFKNASLQSIRIKSKLPPTEVNKQ